MTKTTEEIIEPKLFQVKKPRINDYLEDECMGKNCKKGKMELKEIIYIFKCNKCPTIAKITLK